LHVHRPFVRAEETQADLIAASSAAKKSELVGRNRQRRFWSARTRPSIFGAREPRTPWGVRIVRILYIIVAVLALAFAAGTVAQARSIPNEGMTFEDVAAWLREQGKEATISQDSLGNKIILTSAAGLNFSIYMFDCLDDRCGSLQFASGPHNSPTGKFDLERLNEWNKTKRWVRAYLNGPDSLWLEADFDLAPGSSYELLDDEMATWLKALDAMKTFFAFK
jgi:hypothetical protein